MMTEETMEKSSKSSSWTDKIGEMLLREPKDREQLVELLRNAEQRHLLQTDALEMIEGVLSVADLQVRDIMIPRSQMCVVEIDEKLEDFLPKIIELGHSRFPVIGENKDQVVGILHAKELLSHFVQQSKNDFNLRAIIREPVFIPESKRLNVLLKEFRINHYHMAIVVDEYGGVSGLVTIEDVLEQIVGEIEDEFDVDENIHIKKHDDNVYTINALTPVEDFNEYFQATLSDEEVDTIGGIIIRGLEHVPIRGEMYEVDGFSFKVLSSDKRRIRLLEMVNTNLSAPEADDDESSR